MNLNFSIEHFLDLSNYATDIRVARRKDTKVNSQEFFTPYSIVKRMCDMVSDEDWADPEKTWLEPAAGNGQFVCYIIWNRIMHGIDWETTLRTLFVLELMEDNVIEMKQRVLKLLDEMNVEYDKNIAEEIMEHNIVCHDFFKWNFDEWKEL